MTDKTISQLPAITSLASSDLLAVDQDVGGGNYTTSKITGANLFAGALAPASLAVNGATLGSDKLAVTGSATFSGAVGASGLAVTNNSDTSAPTLSLYDTSSNSGARNWKIGSGAGSSYGVLYFLQGTTPGGAPNTTRYGMSATAIFPTSDNACDLGNVNVGRFRNLFVYGVSINGATMGTDALAVTGSATLSGQINTATALIGGGAIGGYKLAVNGDSQLAGSVATGDLLVGGSNGVTLGSTAAPLGGGGVFRQIQIGAGASAMANIIGQTNTSALMLGTNFYWNSSAVSKYGNSTDAVSFMEMYGGELRFSNAAAGTAGTTITPSLQFRVAASGATTIAGSLAINGASIGSNKLAVAGASSFSGQMNIDGAGSQTNPIVLGGSGQYSIGILRATGNYASRCGWYYNGHVGVGNGNTNYFLGSDAGTFSLWSGVGGDGTGGSKILDLSSGITCNSGNGFTGDYLAATGTNDLRIGLNTRTYIQTNNGNIVTFDTGWAQVTSLRSSSSSYRVDIQDNGGSVYIGGPLYGASGGPLKVASPGTHTDGARISSLPTNTWQTLFALSGTDGGALYIVVASIRGGNGSQMLTALVGFNYGQGAGYIMQKMGDTANLDFQTSSANIQFKQMTGSAKDIDWSVFKINAGSG